MYLFLEKGARRIRRFLRLVSLAPFAYIMLFYVLVYLGIEWFVENQIRLYIYNVFLSLSGVYFAWVLGGKMVMRYVAFFNIFIVVIFSKMLWAHDVIVRGSVFGARTFIAMYIVTGLFLLAVWIWKSPADATSEMREKAIERERKHSRDLEYMVASDKLKQDLIAHANLVKDELQLLEGAWRSNIHDIINDLPTVKEQELYQHIIVPYHSNIISHLRELENKLTFNAVHVPVSDLYSFIFARVNEAKASGKAGGKAMLEDGGWAASAHEVRVDMNKVWDMVLNVLRNSQAALDLKRIDMLRAGKMKEMRKSVAKIHLCFILTEHYAIIRVEDTGGGLGEDEVGKAYRETLPSKKRGGNVSGQGTLFVKFFAEWMGVGIHVENTHRLGEKGLAVELRFPLVGAPDDGDEESYDAIA